MLKDIRIYDVISEQHTDDVATYIAIIPFDLINDECYPLHAKDAINVNPKISH